MKCLAPRTKVLPRWYLLFRALPFGRVFLRGDRQALARQELALRNLALALWDLALRASWLSWLRLGLSLSHLEGRGRGKRSEVVKCGPVPKRVWTQGNIRARARSI